MIYTQYSINSIVCYLQSSPVLPVTESVVLTYQSYSVYAATSHKNGAIRKLLRVFSARSNYQGTA